MVVCVVELAAEAVDGAVVQLSGSVRCVYIVYWVFSSVKGVLVHFRSIGWLVGQAVMGMWSGVFTTNEVVLSCVAEL